MAGIDRNDDDMDGDMDDAVDESNNEVIYEQELNNSQWFRINNPGPYSSLTDALMWNPLINRITSQDVSRFITYCESIGVPIDRNEYGIALDSYLIDDRIHGRFPFPEFEAILYLYRCQPDGSWSRAAIGYVSFDAMGDEESGYDITCSYEFNICLEEYHLLPGDYIRVSYEEEDAHIAGFDLYQSGYGWSDNELE